MKKFVFILVFCSLAAQAQINRFIYEYKYVPDLSKKDTVKKEMMVLDITKEGSRYKSLDRITQDSIMKSEFEKMNRGAGNNMNFRSTSRLGGSNVGYSVTKTYPNYEVYLHERVSRDPYKIKEDEKITWKIEPEKQKIGAYTGQKATTNFGGRSWIAWFSTDLPFPDGPYKFYGLPGLIVKLEDSTGTHVMTLVGNKTVTEQADEESPKLPQGFIVSGMGGKEIPVSEKQFSKVYQEYLQDPSKSLRQMLSGLSSEPGKTVMIQMRTADGKEIDAKDMAKNIDKQAKETEARNNNRIEPTLYSK